MAAFRFAGFDEILAGQFHRSLHGLRSTTDEIHMAHARRRSAHQLVRQCLCHLGREKAGVCIRQLVNLAVHGCQHFRMAMPQAGHCRTAAGIQVAPPLCIHQIHPFTRYRTRRHRAQMAM